ncbi:hypothetical protein RvY_18882 [Ramazzottius varieornatus]|uniref:HIT-type domain-containing protein n=1 Tax=Ramazzottius varieornatus TaxID=947166 RepID=A0A1D1WA58_RAMVA|nr:hypothetical protein RvY_18882 [Ramazzottius varieornatus]
MEQMKRLSFRRQFHVQNPLQREAVPSQSVWPCKICKVSLSKYTCPRCNLPYCSLDCYKSSSHQECAEAFYRQCVMQELQADKLGESSQKKLLETLRQLQEDESGCFPAEDEEADDDDASRTSGSNVIPSLEERFGGMKLDGKEYEEIWYMLTAEEKGDFEEFLKANRLSELIEVWQPWWTIPLPKITVLSPSDDSEEVPSARTDIPALIAQPDLSSLFQRQPSHDTVLFSVLNSLYAYLLITRLYNGDHHNCAELATSNLLEMAVGLSSIAKNQPHSLEEALMMVMLQCDQSSLKSALDSPEARALAMLDLVMVLQQPVFAQAALSDLHALFRRAMKVAKQDEHDRQQYKNVVKKLEYFMAFCQWSRGKVEAQEPLLHRMHANYVKDATEHELLQEKQNRL